MEDGRQLSGSKTIVKLHGHMLLRCRIFFIFFRILERRSRPRCSFLSYNSPSANKRRPQYPAARKTSCIEVVVRWNVRQTWTSGVATLCVFFRIFLFVRFTNQKSQTVVNEQCAAWEYRPKTTCIDELAFSQDCSPTAGLLSQEKIQRCLVDW